MPLYSMPAHLLEMTPNLKRISAAIVNMIESGEKEQLVEMLLNPNDHISWRDATILAVNNKTIFDFFDKDVLLNQEWSRRLKQLNYLNFEIPNCTGDQSISVFSQFIASYLWSIHDGQKKLDEKTEKDFLNIASEFGSYDAWIEKLIGLKNAFISNGGDDLLQQLIQNTLAFSNTFWSAGYFNAGNLLLDTAKACEEQKKDDTIVMMLVEAVLEAYFTAFFLLNDARSEEIIRFHYPKEGWIDIFNRPDLWPTRDFLGARTHLLESIKDNFNIPHAEIVFLEVEKHASEKVKKILDRFNLPETKPEQESILRSK